MAGRVIVAKFKSKCSLCGEWIEPGVEVYWDKEIEDPKMRISHSPACPVIEDVHPTTRELKPKSGGRTINLPPDKSIFGEDDTTDDLPF